MQKLSFMLLQYIMFFCYSLNSSVVFHIIYQFFCLQKSHT